MWEEGLRILSRKTSKRDTAWHVQFRTRASNWLKPLTGQPTCISANYMYNVLHLILQMILQLIKSLTVVEVLRKKLVKHLVLSLKLHSVHILTGLDI